MIFKNIEKDNNVICKLVGDMSDNNSICKEMLQIVGNNNVNVEQNKEYKSSFYNVISNKIIIATKNEEKQKPYDRIIVIAHECIHSIQSKMWLYLNTILSNITIFMFIITAIMVILNSSISNTAIIIYATLTILTLVIRLTLELNAMFRSVDLSSEYLKRYINNKDNELVKNISKKNILLTCPLFILSLSFTHIFRIIILIILYYI